jgi:uncharacterized protein DUF3857/transglutaminase superfamily protein
MPMNSFRGYGVVAAALVLLVCTAPCQASIFGNKDKPEPVPQWAVDAAKTQTPPSAGKSPAVKLFEEYVVTVDGQGHAVERHRVATRILTALGRNYATCVEFYDVDVKLNYFRAWTIAADEHRYQAKDADFIEVGNAQDQIMMMTAKTRAVLPSGSDPGAVVVCESETALPSYLSENFWDVQEDIPAAVRAFEVDLPPRHLYAASWHRYTAVKPAEVAPNHWRWELKDVPALDIRDIPARPAAKALYPRLSVQWGDAALADKDSQWKAIGQWMDQLEAHRPDPTPEITAKAQELTAGAPDFYAKVSRITEYIQKNVRYFIIMRGIGGLQANPAGQIFHNRYGDCKDKTTILISMLQSVGITGHYLFVDDERGVVDPDSPSSYGNHMITAIEVPADVHDPRLMALTKGKNGKTYLIFDPTNERVPAGNLPDYEQGSFGGLAAGADSQLLALPVLDPKTNGGERKGEFMLAANGTLSGSIDSSYMGSAGGEWRSRLKYNDSKERHDNLERMIGREVPGVSLDSYKFSEPEQLDKPIGLQYQLTAHQYARSVGDLLLVRPRVVGTDAVGYNDKPRTFPIEVGATGEWHDSFDIKLPDGYVVDELPEAVDVDMDFASYHSSYTAKGKVLHYQRDYIVRKVELPADRHADFRSLEGRIASDESANAVLKKQ